MSQLKIDDDVICGSKNYKKITFFLDHLYKNNKKQTKKKLQEIEDFCNSSKVKRMLY